jgi:putative ABC transport system permease protein
VREESGIRRLWVGGFGALAAAGAAAFWALGTGPAWMAFAAAFLVLAGFSLLSPVLLPLTRLAFHRAPWLPLRLAAERLRRSMRRNCVTVSALASAVAMLVALVVMVFSFRTSLDAWIGRGIVADLFIAPAANESLGLNSYMPDEAVKWLRGRPEAEGVDTFFEISRDEGFTLAVVDGKYRDNLAFRGWRGGNGARIWRRSGCCHGALRETAREGAGECDIANRNRRRRFSDRRSVRRLLTRPRNGSDERGDIQKALGTAAGDVCCGVFEGRR